MKKLPSKTKNKAETGDPVNSADSVDSLGSVESVIATDYLLPPDESAESLAPRKRRGMPTPLSFISEDSEAGGPRPQLVFQKGSAAAAARAKASGHDGAHARGQTVILPELAKKPVLETVSLANLGRAAALALKPKEGVAEASGKGAAKKGGKKTSAKGDGKSNGKGKGKKAGKNAASQSIGEGGNDMGTDGGLGDGVDFDDPLAFASERLRQAILTPARYVMGIDQALDGTGFAFVLPLFDIKRVEDFIRNDFSRFDVRYESRADEMVDIFRQKLALGGGAISMRPDNSRKKEYSVGLVVGPNHLGNGRNEFPAVILHGHLAIAASNMPEWEQAQLIARAVKDLGEAFIRLVGTVQDGAEVLITVEGLAIHGISGSLGILPCLGALYTRIWEELMSSPQLRGKVREMPIGSWKKAFSDNGRIEKTGIKRLLYSVGFERFGCDDESDATAMALTASTLGYTGKDTMGRIMPTREAKAETRRLKKEKKAKKEERRVQKILAQSGLPERGA